MNLDNLTTLEQFDTWLSTHIGKLDYYDYTLGDLISFKGTGLKTVGKNLLPLSVETYKTINTNVSWNGNVGTLGTLTITLNDDGSFRIQGSTSSTQYFWIATNLHYNGRYVLNGFNSATFGIYLSMQNATWITGSSIYATYDLSIENNANVFCRIGVANNIDETIYPMLRLSTVLDDTFEPYTESVLNLPTLDYFSTGMKSVEEVYDELTESKAIARITSITLNGSENWIFTTYNRVYVALPNAKTGTINGFVADKYLIYSGLGDSYCAVINVNGNLVIYVPSDITSADDWKTWLATHNITVQYELATPVITTIDEDLTFRVEEGGTEQLLPINGSTPTTSNIVANIDYMSIEDVMNHILDNLDILPTILGRLQMVENATASIDLRLTNVEGDTSDLIDEVDTINDNITNLTTSVASKLSCSIIWQNPKESGWLNTFAGTTIDVTAQNVSQYTYIEGIFILDSGAPYAVSTGFVPLDFSLVDKTGYGCGQYIAQSGTNNEYIMYERDITYYTNNLVISDCTVRRSGTVAYSENSHLIPALILGYK